MTEEEILAEIHEAFKDVSRHGGVSWSESEVIDDYGSDEERQLARMRDTDTTWQEVADDPTWWVDMGVGGLSFLDPIGYRYYLPACMTVAIRGGFYEWLLYSLTIDEERELRDYKLKQWSLLDECQKRCVKHFIEFMLARANEEPNDLDRAVDTEYWKLALDRYWGQVPDAS